MYTGEKRVLEFKSMTSKIFLWHWFCMKTKCNKSYQEIFKYYHQVDWIRISLKMYLERDVPTISKILCLNPMKTLWTFSFIVHIHEKYYWNTVQIVTEAIMIWKPFWKPLNVSFDRVCARNLKFFGHNHLLLFFILFSLWSDRSNVLNPPVSTFSIKDQL